MTWTHTSRGRALDLADPQLQDIDLEEIGEALGHLCRYNGCVRQFYSVGQHCVLMSEWLEQQGEPLEVQLGALLHDAAEAYLGDLTWPVQALLWGRDDEHSHVVRLRYKVAQGRLDHLIAQAVGLDVAWLRDERVKRADLRILLDERAALLTEPPPRPWFADSAQIKPLGVRIEPWWPMLAANAWLLRLSDLRRRLGLG